MFQFVLTLTTGCRERGAALRGHPQVCRAGIKHHVEHLGRRADADFSIVLSLIRLNSQMYIDMHNAKSDLLKAIKSSSLNFLDK